MEGRVSNFERVLADFESRLKDAEYVAIDTELTGTELYGEPDTFEDSASVRLDRICRIAERYTLIQLGLTIVGRSNMGNGDESLVCSSYNLFAFPQVDCEVPGQDAGIVCQAKALQFNARHGVDFNTWIAEGIPYMSREEERRYLATNDNKYIDANVGLLRLWKALCNARLPFVVHTPLDLFFLLAAFERRPLPRSDPRAIAALIRKCTPKVFDTAYLHGSMDKFKRLGLMNYFEDVQASYEALARTGPHVVPCVEFHLQGQTAARYSKPLNELAHEAGFDSLVTAQLFTYLRAIAPTQVRESGNRLFLFRSVEYLDLDRAAAEGEISRCMWDLSRVTLLVAVLDPRAFGEARREISAAGYTYRAIDSLHVLVVLRASGGAAVRRASELAAQVHAVQSWMPFDRWRSMQASSGPRPAPGTPPGDTCESVDKVEPYGGHVTNGTNGCNGSNGFHGAYGYTSANGCVVGNGTSDGVCGEKAPLEAVAAGFGPGSRLSRIVSLLVSGAAGTLLVWWMALGGRNRALALGSRFVRR